MLAIYLIGSYLIGTFMTATIMGTLRGVQLQHEGSGNIGARNAGRVLGKAAFLWTVVGDGGKALLVIVIGHALDFSVTLIALACTLCVMGHIYPFWLRFKGGMGVATCISSMVFLTPLAVLTFLAGSAVSLALTKSFTLSMIIGFITYSIGLLVLMPAAWPLLLAVAIVTWHHRSSVMERFHQKKGSTAE